jgi:hypothetical protein
MEFNLDRLDNAIYYYLTLNAEQALSLNKIYNALITDNICPELLGLVLNKREENKKLFHNVCEHIEKQYDNIEKINKDNIIYLKFTNVKKDKVYNDINEELYDYCAEGNVQKCKEIFGTYKINYNYTKNNLTFYDVLPKNENGLLLCRLISTYETYDMMFYLKQQNNELREQNTTFYKLNNQYKKEIFNWKSKFTTHITVYMSVSILAYGVITYFL